MSHSPSPDAAAVPPDISTPQYTLRAVLTGMILGGVLSLCNVYAGLKIGWGFNMSITAALLSFAFWQGMHRAFGTRGWNILENNINQTAASSAAAISSAGLVAPIPAWTILTGERLTWLPLTLWVGSVALVGVVVAVALRRQMLLVDNLPFPGGIATGQTLIQMYASGAQAMARVKALLAAAFSGIALKATVELAHLKHVVIPGGFSMHTTAGASQVMTLQNMGFTLDPSVLMIGIGGIIGTRAAVSLLLGAVLCWGVLGPQLLALGWIQAGKSEVTWFKEIVDWTLWPGVVLMVASSLTSFAFSWRSVVRAMIGRGRAGAGDAEPPGYDVPRRVYVLAVVFVVLASVLCQVYFFHIAPLVALLGVLLTFVLAVVAGRVSGETGITPVGPMGKITQLTFGVIAPADVTANLMTANVTGGAASQCADLLHDLKTGLMIGARPRYQAYAQSWGAVAGALVGSAAYLILIPDPKSQLITDEWAAPAVVQWKAVAEVLAKGLDHLPVGTVDAMVVAAIAGIILAVIEKLVPKSALRWVPSPGSIGLAMVVPAYYSLSMFLGGMAAAAARRWATSWADRFVIVIAAGLIAGESLAGIGFAIHKLLAG